MLEALRDELHGHEQAAARALAGLTAGDVATTVQDQEIKTLRAVLDD